MLLKELIQKDDTVFDIGANVGNKTELFLKYGARVICVEPQKCCLDKLYDRFLNNSNVTIVPYAVSSDGSPRMFRISSATTLSTFSEEFIKRTSHDRFKNYTWGNPIEIETTSLNNLIDKYGTPSYCKIDVEGGEKDILQGLSHPIPVISFEYTPELHDLAMECVSILCALSNYKFRYSEGESMEYSVDKSLNAEDLNNYLITQSNKIVFGDIYAELS